MSTLEDLQDAIGLKLSDKPVIMRAFVSKSYTSEHPEIPSNERLEFLGDAVLGLVLAEHYYGTAPAADQGELTRLRIVKVEEKSVANAARRLGLWRYLKTGRGVKPEELRGDKLMGDTFEAFVGAIFLEFGLLTASHVVIQSLIYSR